MFKHKLRDLRKEHKLTQNHLATILDCSVASVCLMENGQRQPNTEILAKLSEYFQVSIDWLMSERGIAVKEKLKENTITVIRRDGTYEIYHVNDEQLKEIVKFLDNLTKDTSLKS